MPKLKDTLSHGQIKEIDDAYSNWMKRRGLVEHNKWNGKDRSNTTKKVASNLRNKDL